ncbi:phage tail protein [Ochrovirga pacifica]|uniref:phage tail protein n=1 Tax=Ochrovirga pacifica TaxID=1042376 RepID=UPI000255A7D6|nr:tail fiber protein [Ochrovirga pacifica]
MILLGEIRLFGFGFTPRGWVQCKGQLMSITLNQALFSLLGTTYGGDGRTTFALPDLRGRTPVGFGSGTGLQTINFGEKGGKDHQVLLKENLPAHHHTASLKVSNQNASQNAATSNASIATSGTHQGRTFNAIENYNQSSPNTSLHQESIAINNTGNGTPFNNRNPYLGLNYCIAIAGVYPSRE